MLKNYEGQWWSQPEGTDIHSEIFAHIEELDLLQSEQRYKDSVHRCIYSNDHVLSGSYAFTAALQGSGVSPVSLNVSRNMVDTVTAKIGKNHPSIKCSTDGAEWSIRLRGRLLGKFLNAKLDETRFRRIAPLVFRDCAIVGTGVVKTCVEHAEIKPERVPKEELFVDPLESRYGSPRQLHHRKQYAREVLEQMFPDSVSAIRQANSSTLPLEGYPAYSGRDSNMVDVIESWHLASSPDSEDGRHSICIAEATLLSEAWDAPSFPFAFLHWSAPDKGFWGTGLIEELATIQYAIDQTMQSIRESLHIGAKLKVFLERNSKIIKTQLNNKLGSITEFSGRPPIFEAPSPVSPQVLQHLDYLFNKAYEIAGVSQMSAQSKMPGGFGDSQPAIQSFYDIETERFSQQATSYLNLYLDAAEQFIVAAKEIHLDNPDYSGSWVDRSLMEKIRWEDVDLHRDQFKLKLEGTNAVTGTIPGKLATLNELLKLGILPQQILGPNIDNPDLERVFSTINAAHNNIQWTIGLLEDTDKDLPEPEPFQDLQLGINLVKAAYNDNQASGAPEEVQERFQEWLQNAQAVLTMSTPQGPQTAPGAPVEGGNVALPMPAPTLPDQPLPPSLPIPAAG